MRTSIATAALLAALAGAGCSHRALPEPSPAEAHPLALRAPIGTGPLDVLIGGLQDRLRRDPRSTEAWASLGEAWVRKARQAAAPGLYRSADDAASAALALAPGARRAEVLRGLLLLEEHRFEEARAHAGRLLSRHSDCAPALGILSDALLELGRFEEAAAAAQRMLDLKPDLPAYARASHLLWLQGDADGALEAARLAVDAGGDPEARAWVLTQDALIRWNRGDLDGADQILARALRDQPDHSAALAACGRVAISRGDAEGATRWLTRALERAPLAETAWLLAQARRLAGDGAGARVAEARTLEYGRASDRRTAALLLATEGGDPGEAVRLAQAERAVRGGPYTEDALAWTLFRAGRLDEAGVAASRAIALGTPDARLLWHAGAICLARGERREGAALLRRALRLNPAFDLAGAEEARRLLAPADGPQPARTGRRP